MSEPFARQWTPRRRPSAGHQSRRVPVRATGLAGFVRGPHQNAPGGAAAGERSRALSEAPPQDGRAEFSGGSFDSLDFDVDVLVFQLAALVAAFVLALPVGWDREQQRRSPGLRTFPLVAMSSCAYVLVARAVLEGSAEGHSRVLQGLMTGIGFVGGGAILKSGGGVRGTATAASIWTMGAMGAAIAYGRYEIALPLAVVTFGVLRWLKPFKSDVSEP